MKFNIFLSGIFALLLISSVSAVLCRGSDGYYYDCNSWYIKGEIQTQIATESARSYREGFTYGYYTGYNQGFYDGYDYGYYSGREGYQQYYDYTRQRNALYAQSVPEFIVYSYSYR